MKLTIIYTLSAVLLNGHFNIDEKNIEPIESKLRRCASIISPIQKHAVKILVIVCESTNNNKIDRF